MFLIWYAGFHVGILEFQDSLLLGSGLFMRVSTIERVKFADVLGKIVQKNWGSLWLSKTKEERTASSFALKYNFLH
jgi:hypothetical protein